MSHEGHLWIVLLLIIEIIIVDRWQWISWLVSNEQIIRKGGLVSVKSGIWSFHEDQSDWNEAFSDYQSEIRKLNFCDVVKRKPSHRLLVFQLRIFEENSNRVLILQLLIIQTRAPQDQSCLHLPVKDENVRFRIIVGRSTTRISTSCGGLNQDDWFQLENIIVRIYNRNSNEIAYTGLYKLN